MSNDLTERGSAQIRIKGNISNTLQDRAIIWQAYWGGRFVGQAIVDDTPKDNQKGITDCLNIALGRLKGIGMTVPGKPLIEYPEDGNIVNLRPTK